MGQITITEALAEQQTIIKRLAQKEEFQHAHAVRLKQMVDPLAAAGGSKAALEKDVQAYRDLAARYVLLRHKMLQANLTNNITLRGETKPIYDWLVWRRDLAPKMQVFYQRLVLHLQQMRAPRRQGQAIVGGNIAVNMADVKQDDLEVNLNESKLYEDKENLEAMLGELDGLLSLKNATITIEA